MTSKEKEFQRALGLEKGYVVRLSVIVPVFVSVPIVAKGFSQEEVRERLQNLPDDEKKKVLHHICKTIIGTTDQYDRDYRVRLGENAIDEIRTMANARLKNLDPKDLDTDYSEIETYASIDTEADAIQYIMNEIGLEEDEILII